MRSGSGRLRLGELGVEEKDGDLAGVDAEPSD